MTVRTAAGTPLALGGWLLAGFLGAALLLLLGAMLVGNRAVVVLSGSMEPALSPGDVLIERPIAASRVEIGQVVTFHDPDSDRMLTHRVRRIEARGRKLVFVTKGDADNGIQRWSVSRDGGLAQPFARVPAIGWIAMLAKTPPGLVGIVLLPLLAVAGWEIFRVWRPVPDEDPVGAGRAGP
jgi:signal peptidase